MNNDDVYIQYLLEMGALSPEQEKLMRQQSYVDSLRQNATAAPEGQMVGRAYVAPSWTQYAAQLGNAFMARKGQQKLDEGYAAQKGQEISAVERIRQLVDARKRNAGPVTPAAAVPQARPWTKRLPNEDEPMF